MSELNKLLSDQEIIQRTIQKLEWDLSSALYDNAPKSKIQMIKKSIEDMKDQLTMINTGTSEYRTMLQNVLRR